MSRTKKAMLAARQDPAAPYLFDEEQMPLRHDVVDLVKQGHHRHTGQRLLENEKMCFRMVELLLAKWGVKRISEEMHVSKCSIREARKALVARGEMDPWKQRIVTIQEDIVEASNQKYLDAVENNEVSVDKLPINAAITQDKRAVILGEPTSIDLSARVVANPGAITVEKLRSFLQSIESDSDGKKRIAEQTVELSASDVTIDVGAGSGGGGGSVPVEGVECSTHSVQSNQTTKEP